MNIIDTLPKHIRSDASKRVELEKEKHGNQSDLVTRTACAMLDVTFLDITEANVCPRVLHKHWQLFMKERVLPLYSTGILMTIATDKPWDERLVRRIRGETRMQVEAIGASELEIDRVFAEIGKPPRVESEVANRDLHEVETLRSWSSNSTPAQLVREIIRSAYYQKASDIHMEPWADRVVVRFRIHGSLETMPPLPKSEGDEVIRAFKQMASLPLSENQTCSSARITCEIDDANEIDLRMEKQPVIHGEAIVARLLDDRMILEMKGALPFSRPQDQGLAKSILNKSAGMFITTGPTGSGKTTTNYLCIASVDRKTRKVCSAEDPIEYVMDGVQQVSINPLQGNRTFANVLRSNLRCDPDILVVGEIRDEETADISARAVQTGHLVMATLHTNDAIGVIPRLMGLGVPAALVSQILSLVVSQRLCYELCNNCKTQVKPTKDIVDHYKYYNLTIPSVIYEKCGCKECLNLGTVGRVPIFEFLHLNKELKSLIKIPFDEVAFRARWLETGGRNLAIDGLEKVAQGITSYEQVSKYDEDYIPEFIN